MASEVFIRNSEQSCFKNCRQQWWWAYVECLRAKRASSPLSFGDLIHRALAVYYKPGIKRGPHPAKVFTKIYAEHLSSGLEPVLVKIGGNRVDASELGPHMLENYIDEYGDDRRYEVIAPEQTFQVDVHHPKTGKYMFTVVGTGDAVVRDRKTRKLGMLEHKTGAGLDPFGAPLPLDEQAGTYWTFFPIFLRAQGVLAEDEDLDFILYNRLRKAFKDERPRNAEGHYLNKPHKADLTAWLDDHRQVYRKAAKMDELMELIAKKGQDPLLLGAPSENQGQPLFKREMTFRSPEDRRRIFERYAHEAREMRYVREGKLGVYKNPDRHCGWCEFRDMCEVHETGSDWKAIRSEMFTTWEPYADHADARDETDAA